MVKRKSSYFLRGEVFFNLTRTLIGVPRSIPDLIRNVAGLPNPAPCPAVNDSQAVSALTVRWMPIHSGKKRIQSGRCLGEMAAQHVGGLGDVLFTASRQDRTMLSLGYRRGGKAVEVDDQIA